MRHERIAREDVAAAAWPRPIEAFAPTVPAEEISAANDDAPAFAGPTPAVPDVAPSVGGLIVGAYAALVLVFFAFFAGSFLALFAITISALFVTIFFAVPRIFLAVEPDESRRPSLAAFMDKGMTTLTGHCSGRDALLQMLIVPVLLSLGLLAMGIAGAIYL